MSKLCDFYFIQALGFVRKHNGAHLNRSDLIKRTVEYLQVGFDLSDSTAERHAVRALCEFESSKTSLYLDIDSSTSTMLIVRDARRKVARVITIADIAAMLSTAKLAPLRTPSYSDAMSGQSLPDSDAAVFDEGGWSA